jgi:magnesium transporter
MPTERTSQDWEERLAEVLERRDAAELQALLEEMHAADLADAFIDLDEPAQIAILEALSDEQAAELLAELDPDERAAMLDQLTVERTTDVLEEMSSDDAADVLAELPRDEADALLERMEPEAADDVAELLRYSDDTAGGLMAKEFVHAGPDTTVAETLDLLRTQYADAEMIYDIYVLDEEERLLGVVTLRDLIAHEPETPLSDLMHREYESVHTDQPQDEVAEIVRRHDLLAVPVLDDDGRLHGIVTVDDIGQVVQEEAAEDLLSVSGGEEMDETPTPWTVRPGWRSGLLALLGALALSAVIWALSRSAFFIHPPAQWTPAAILLPLLLILGITLSNQAALAMDMAYARAAESRQLGRVFRREVLAGLGMALLGGVLAALILLVLHQPADRLLRIALALALGCWLASLTGAVGALLVRRRNLDLGPYSHTLIVVVALLAAVSVDLWIAR